MSRDSSRTHLHLHHAAHADLFEEFTRLPLLPDTIYLQAQHMPMNPEDEDDVVPDQHAAFGIQKATKDSREPVWRDLGLAGLMSRGPAVGGGPSGERSASGGAAGVGGSLVGGLGSAGAGAGAAAGGSAAMGLRSAAQGGVVVGPVHGGIGVPVGVRAGMRGAGVPAVDRSGLMSAGLRR